MHSRLQHCDRDYFAKFLGGHESLKRLDALTSPAGQAFIYWLYQSMNLYLVSKKEGLVGRINRGKEIFIETISDPERRSKVFKEHFIRANSSIIFTQECDGFFPLALTENGEFYSVESQNGLDGCFVFLDSKIWDSSYEVLSIEDYPPFKMGRVTVILAKMHTGEAFLLASAHGSSTNSEDARLQVTLLKKLHDQIREERGYDQLQFVVGIDANTKSKEDIRLLNSHLDDLGLLGTHVGPTTVKRRLLTTQFHKSGKKAIDEEDFIITLKPENGANRVIINSRVGFESSRADIQYMIPSVQNPSDHYPVGVSLERIK